MNHFFEPSVDDLLLIEENQSMFYRPKPIGTERKNRLHLTQRLSKPLGTIEDAFSSLAFTSNNTLEDDAQRNSLSSLDRSALISVGSTMMTSSHQDETRRKPLFFTADSVQGSNFMSTTTMDPLILSSEFIGTNLSVSRPSPCIASAPLTVTTPWINQNGFIRRMNRSQQELPRYLPRLSAPRERFRVNSIGRPILRTQIHDFHLRR